MPLVAGQKLGDFEVLSLLGAGGMGEVYRARDAKLGREVAIKVLSDVFSENEERRARLEREAKSLAALNHPSVATLYSLEESHGTQFLVMELVEGETLAERIARGPLSVEESLSLFYGIAEGLEAAHEKGIIHRDLKPANIKVKPDGKVKILDYGLAKVFEDEPVTDNLTELRTVTRGTATGVILGTAAYMSPEQARGQRLDKRTDIWSFGCCLYETLTGKNPFVGVTFSDTVVKILDRESDWSALPRDTPASIRTLLRRCLAKKKTERIHDIADARIEIGAALLGAEEVEPPRDSSAGPRSSLKRWALVAAGGAIGAVVTATLLWRTLGPLETAVLPLARFTIELVEDESLNEFNGASVAVSPDGTRIAYVAHRERERGVYVRALDELQSRRVLGTGRARSPFFSPDGEWIGFEAGGKLMKVHVRGGAPEFLANLAFFAGASWGPDDNIVYTPSFMRGLFTISARGGQPQRLTTPEKNQGHIWPEILPDGKNVLFTIWKGESHDRSDIGVLSLETGKWNVIVESGFYGRYAPTGHVLYLRAGTLYAAPLDLEQQRLTAPAAPVAEGVLSDSIDGAGLFAVSSTGSLVYAAGTTHAPARTLVRVDRSGRSSAISAARAPYSSPRVSPDGKRLALFLDGGNISIWVYDFAQDRLTRISFGADDHNVAWSPDGARVAFESGRGDGVHQIYVRPADGSGDVEQITSGDHDHYLCDWSPDGRFVAFVEFHPQTGADLWVVDVEAREPRVFLNSDFYEKSGAFSPNGRWLAYVSDESGQYEVYVQSFPAPGLKRLVSSGGGEEPAWAPSGRELYYRNGGRMMAVAVNEEPEFTASRPETLFEGLYQYAPFPTRTYDVDPDGGFVMVAEPGPEESTRRLIVVLNWASELEQANR